jgi:ribosomal-protein-alanine N-acetyltransferase
MIVRPLKSDEYEEVKALESACGLCPWTREGYLFAFEDAAHAALGAFAVPGGALLGFVITRLITKTTSFQSSSFLQEMEILSIAVAPASRRTGVGSALLVAGLPDGVTAYGPVFLEARSANRGAIAFYERHGFRRTGLRRGYYSDPPDDAVLMTLDVPAPECRLT